MVVIINIGILIGSLFGWYGLLFNLVVIVGVILQRDVWKK
jgi:hypothetical protein